MQQIWQPSMGQACPQLIAAVCFMKVLSTCQASLKGPTLPLSRVWLRQEQSELGTLKGLGAFQETPGVVGAVSHPAPLQAGAVFIAAELYYVVGAFCWELLRQRNKLLPLTGIRALFRLMQGLQEGKNPLEKPSGVHYLLKLEKQVAQVINTWVASVNPAKAALLSQRLQVQINCFWDQEHIYKCDWSHWWY